MTEEEARAWLKDVLAVPRETLMKLERFVGFLRDEAHRQNLVAASTLDHIWTRHVVDSAQLIPLASRGEGAWLDLGSGAGFPGLVVAALTDRPVLLVESRRKRCAFLEAAIDRLEIGTRVTVQCCRVEALPSAPFAVISARAFAPLDRLLGLAERFALPSTLWLLPKGRNAANELDAVRSSWQGTFRIVPSITEPDAAILELSDVRRRRR